MIKIETIQELNELHTIEQTWNVLRKKTKAETLSYKQYIATTLKDTNIKNIVVIVVYNNDDIVAILPFAVFLKPKKFVIGEYQIFSIQHKVLHISSPILGDISKEQAYAILETLSKLDKYDAINLYELAITNNLYKTALEKKLNLHLSPYIKNHFPHWIIDFPDSFSVYLSNFSSKTRNSLKRKIKKFQKAYLLKLEKFTNENQVEEFLKKGERISRQTYQWDLGARLIHNQQTIETFKLSAKQNELHCYLLFANEEPIAFLRGNIINNTFYYGTPGFLREYSKFSPGIVMLLLVFEDLIDNTSCRSFDFGMGGDMMGYKSLFGNYFYDASLLEFYPCKTLKSFCLFLLDNFIWGIKIFLKKIIKPSVKTKIKKILRDLKILK